VKANKEMLPKTVNFMPSRPGGIAKFKASFQPILQSFVFLPMKGRIFRKITTAFLGSFRVVDIEHVFIVRVFHILPSSKFTFTCWMVTDSKFSSKRGLVLFHMADVYR